MKPARKSCSALAAPAPNGWRNSLAAVPFFEGSQVPITRECRAGLSVPWRRISISVFKVITRPVRPWSFTYAPANVVMVFGVALGEEANTNEVIGFTLRWIVSPSEEPVPLEAGQN